MFKKVYSYLVNNIKPMTYVHTYKMFRATAKHSGQPRLSLSLDRADKIQMSILSLYW